MDERLERALTPAQAARIPREEVIDLDGEPDLDHPRTRYVLNLELAHLTGWASYQHATDGMVWRTWTHDRCPDLHFNYRIPTWAQDEQDRWRYPGPSPGDPDALDFLTWKWAGWLLEHMNRLGWACELQYPTDPPFEVVCMMSTTLHDEPGGKVVACEWWVDAPGRAGAPAAIALATLCALRAHAAREEQYTKKTLKIPKQFQTVQEKPRENNIYGLDQHSMTSSLLTPNIYRQPLDLPASLCSACGGGAHLKPGRVCDLCGYPRGRPPQI